MRRNLHRLIGRDILAFPVMQESERDLTAGNVNTVHRKPYDSKCLHENLANRDKKTHVQTLHWHPDDQHVNAVEPFDARKQESQACRVTRPLDRLLPRTDGEGRNQR